MAVYVIAKKGEDVLRDIAKEVREITPNILRLLENMKDTMYNSNGVGLAAPQIGISKRIIVVDAEEDLLELINPEIVEESGAFTDTEGCLSVPGYIGDVTRAFKVKVKAVDREGRRVELVREGLTARALQHEIDHLNGILFIDKAVNIRPQE